MAPDLAATNSTNASKISCALATPSCLSKPPFPAGQRPCNESMTDPASEWGYQNCSSGGGGGGGTHAVQHRARQLLAIDDAVLSQGGWSDTASSVLRAVVAAPAPAPPPAAVYCCNYCGAVPGNACPAGGGSVSQNHSCVAFDHPGHLCRDPLCDNATSAAECSARHTSQGPSVMCIPQYPAQYGYPVCGAPASPKPLCQTQCEGKPAPPGPPKPPPPPPPSPPVYCCNCPLSSCVASKHSHGTQHFCTAPNASNTLCQTVPAGSLCSSPMCHAGEGSAANCSKLTGCLWDGGATPPFPKCGMGSLSLAGCKAKCSPPPKPACTAANNWWDLFEDTGQWAVDEAGCDQSTCPYPVGAGAHDRCDPYPFYCCNPSTKRCEVWNGEDMAHTCPAGPFTGWDGQSRCQDSCSDADAAAELSVAHVEE